MNHITRILFFLAVSFILIPFSGCSDDDAVVTPTPTNNTEVTFTVNGGAYSNKSFTIQGNSAAVYDPNEKLTGITFAGKEGTKNISCTIGWGGTSTGTRSWGTNNPHDSASVEFMDDTYIYSSEQGTLTITEFGAVGGYVKGTFSGSFSLFLSGQTVTVTNGKFTAKRII